MAQQQRGRILKWLVEHYTPIATCVQRRWIWKISGLVLTVTLVIVAYRRAPDDDHAGWSWQTPVPASLPAVRIHVPAGTSKLVLQVHKNDERTLYHLAETDAAVVDWWRNPAENLQKEQLTHLTSCRDGVNEVSKDDPVRLAGRVKCTRNGAALDIELLPPQVEKEKPTNPKKGEHAPKPDEKAADNGTPKDPRTESRDLWLIPFQPSSMVGAHRMTSLAWSKIEHAKVGQTGNTSIEPKNCRDEGSLKQNQDGKDGCLAAKMILDDPPIVQDDDPKLDIAETAADAERELIPVVFTVMKWIDGMLLIAMCGVCVAWFLTGVPFSLPLAGRIVDAERRFRGIRSYLQWLESMGPAVAFALTTLGLLLAFRSRAVAGNEAAFQQNIALAMAATLLGLVMRVLAHTLDRIIDHLAHWHADEDGLVEPPREQSNNGGSS